MIRTPPAAGWFRAALLSAALAAACAPPSPPHHVPRPAPPEVAAARLEDGPNAPAPLLPLPARLRWTPGTPGEGTFVALSVMPDRFGLPIFELRGRAGGQEIGLAPLSGGSYLGLVAAPLGHTEVRVEITVTLIDGTRFTQPLTLRIAPRDFAASRLRVDSRFTAPDSATLLRIEHEQELVRATLRTVSAELLWRGSFVAPLVGATTSPYGQRRLFNDEARSRHTGLDIDGKIGDPVLAANSGRVVLSRDLFFNGEAVFIDHGLGLLTGYFHLSEREVSEGQWVEKGELIGRVGATGRVTGPHLHWSLYLQGFALDPSTLLDPAFAQFSERLAAPPAALEP